MDARATTRNDWWFHEYSDAELGAALRVFLADPNLPQYGNSAVVGLEDIADLLAGHARDLREARGRGLARTLALLAVHTTSYRWCSCVVSPDCDEHCARFENSHCAHCDGSTRPLLTERQAREYLGITRRRA